MAALSIGAVLLGERHNDPRAKNMAAAMINAKKVRYLLIEAAGLEISQNAVITSILDDRQLPPSQLNNLALAPVNMLGSRQDWIPVIDACYKNKTLLVYADKSLSDNTKTTPTGMAIRDIEMAGHLNIVSSFEWPDTPRGAGVLLLCGAAHLEGIKMRAKNWNVSAFDLS